LKNPLAIAGADEFSLPPTKIEGNLKMATYWISFRLESRTVGGRTYDERYAALVEAVNQHVTSAWEETTSFWLVRSNATRPALAAAIRRAIAPSEDMVLIGSMEHLGATAVGSVKKLPTLQALIPDLTAS
jgi:hypothetical protein